MDLLNMAVMGSILAYVWRAQDLWKTLGTIQFPSLISLAAIGLFVFDSDARRSLRGIKNPVTTSMCVIVALAILSVPMSLNRGLSFYFVTDDLLKSFALFLILAASIRSVADVKRYSVAMLAGGAFYAFLVETTVNIGASGRLSNLAYYDANDLGALLVDIIPFCLYFLVRAKNRVFRALSGATIILFILVIIKTGSRGAFLGLLVIGGYLLFVFREIPARVRWTAVIVGAGTLIVMGGAQYWEDMGTLLNLQADYNWSGKSDAGRIEVWTRGVGYMVTHPITGVGVSAFPVAEGTISPIADKQELGIGVKWSAAHNSFVQIGAELGIGGLIAFIALCYYGYRISRGGKSKLESHGFSDARLLGHTLAASMVGFVCTGFFLSMAYSAFIFTLCGLIVGVAKLAPKPVPNSLPQTSARRGRSVRSAPDARGATGGGSSGPVRGARAAWPRAY